MSKQLTDIEINHIAKLAHLTLSESERKLFASQLSSVLDYVAMLKKVDTGTVEPTNQVTGLTNVERLDETVPSLSQQKTLSNVKAEKGLFRVKAIFDEQD